MVQNETHRTILTNLQTAEALVTLELTDGRQIVGQIVELEYDAEDKTLDTIVLLMGTDQVAVTWGMVMRVWTVTWKNLDTTADVPQVALLADR